MASLIDPRARVTYADSLPVLLTERLTLRLLRPREAGKMVRYVDRNRDRFEPWAPLPPIDHYSERRWRRFAQISIREARMGTAYRFVLLDPADDREVLGAISLRDIYLPNCYVGELGYTVDRSIEGRGYLTEGLHAVIQFAFEDLNLHRLEACTMPANERSIRVLERMGFEREGRLRKSLMVQGEWEDHLLWSRLNEKWRRP